MYVKPSVIIVTLKGGGYIKCHHLEGFSIHFNVQEDVAPLWVRGSIAKFKM